MKQLIILSFSLCLMACHHQNDKVEDKKVTETNPSMVTKRGSNNNELTRSCVSQVFACKYLKIVITIS